VQLLSLEKKIESLHITRSTTEKTLQIANEALEISSHIDRVTRLSNLALLLYRWFVLHGHARNKEDEKELVTFFKSYLPADTSAINGFYEKLYFYQSYSWYAFIKQDFLMYYRYSQKWIDLFEEQPLMIEVETGHYVKGMHNLLNALFDLRNFEKFEITLKQFEQFEKSPVASRHDNFRIHTSIYITGAKINQHLMKGTFAEGLKLVPLIEKSLEEYALFVDPHRILVFNYKLAMLYFGAGKFEKAIDYLQRIINGPVDLRIDLHCYARLLHLMAHYELGNYELMESLTKSVYRFMAKMKSLTVVEEEMFGFLRHSFDVSPEKIKPELKKFLHKIKHLEKNPFETRSFAYLDVISWVESKVNNKPMGDVIFEKYKKHKKRRYTIY
jgi:tetratricopeptide (TPR) repeat protein